MNEILLKTEAKPAYKMKPIYALSIFFMEITFHSHSIKINIFVGQKIQDRKYFFQVFPFQKSHKLFRVLQITCKI